MDLPGRAGRSCLTVAASADHADLSLGEFGALVAKAMRGVGYPWGLTEEASHAAKRLAASGLAAGEIMLRLADAVDGTETTDLMPDDLWQPVAEALCPMCVGTALADVNGFVGETLRVGPVREPVLIAPFLMGISEDGGYVIAWDGGRCKVFTDGMRVEGEQPDTATPVEISKIRSEASGVVPEHRVHLAGDVLARLERFAQRTYAPATEASRLGGAGAGTSDND